MAMTTPLTQRRNILRKADIAIINLETALTNEGRTSRREKIPFS